MTQLSRSAQWQRCLALLSTAADSTSFNLAIRAVAEVQHWQLGVHEAY